MVCFGEDTQKRAAKTTVDKLLKVRRTLNPHETVFTTQINDCIERIRSISRLSDNQREEVVLYSIEVQGATTLVEIAEDCRLDKRIVVEILQGLVGRREVYQVSRLVVGSDRPQFMYKSARMKVGEMA